ncbi:hypothetical protein SJAG_03549 [Schizosaccharomyces japonicus yFS275]|uniref:Uncharacterized protein n=1 Tax=Schizosaccharomyces japonicus (strain yFS275 / FY16936) TaxID=402676 RepID=B6K4I8_SCHJY|nr:hypothetical protein SJAG_03549 [Schizosaccharomyces japonicus yFS275]EEB08395.1 hypothetical protein SJAG_03549 [Schizosaccharomyces japonicus yFS275]
MGRPLQDELRKNNDVILLKKTKQLMENAIQNYNMHLAEHQQQLTFSSAIESLDPDSSVMQRIFEVFIREIAGAQKQKKLSHRTVQSSQVVERQLTPTIYTSYTRIPIDTLSLPRLSRSFTSLNGTTAIHENHSPNPFQSSISGVTTDDTSLSGVQRR